MSSIEQTNATTQVSTINDSNDSTTASENHAGSRESYSGNRSRGRGRGRGRGGGRGRGRGRGGSSHDYRSHNSSNQVTTPTNSSPQTNNSSSNDTHSMSNRNDSTPRRNRGRTQRISQRTQSQPMNDNNIDDNVDSNTSERGNRGSESVSGGGRGYNRNRFHHRHQYQRNSNYHNDTNNNNNNNNIQNNYNQNTSTKDSSQNENRDQEREHYSGYGSSSRNRNNRSDRSKGVARTIPDENLTEIQNPSNLNQNNNESKIDETNPKGKTIVSITEASSSSSSTDQRKSHPRPMKSSMAKLSPEEIKDVLTSITHGLSTSTYECMICCENIRPNHKTWFCGVCWAVFHLNCTQKWARKSSNGSRTSETWRCPGCQNISDVIPEKYKCFCGKLLFD